MADAALKEKIRDVLRRDAFTAPDDVVDVSDGEFSGLVHVVVISHKFDGHHVGERTELICTELERRFSPDEWGQVSLAVGVSPSQVNGAPIEELKAL